MVRCAFGSFMLTNLHCVDATKALAQHKVCQCRGVWFHDGCHWCVFTRSSRYMFSPCFRTLPYYTVSTQS